MYTQQLDANGTRQTLFTFVFFYLIPQLITFILALVLLAYHVPNAYSVSNTVLDYQTQLHELLKSDKRVDFSKWKPGDKEMIKTGCFDQFLFDERSSLVQHVYYLQKVLAFLIVL